jgi:WD repeat-containing protein 76
MAPPPHVGLTDYERLCEENVRCNAAILASLNREAAELSASFHAPSPKQPRRQPPQPHSTSPVVVRRSLRNRGHPPSASSSLATPPSPPKPGTTRISSSLAGSLRASAAAATEDGFNAGRELVLWPADVRRVVPERILSVRILPLAHRTVVGAGNQIGHIGLWDVDGVMEDEDGDGAEGVFQYFPHRGPMGAIVVHPAAPGKVMIDFFTILHLCFIGNSYNATWSIISSQLGV